MASMPDPMGTIQVQHVTASNAQVALQAAATVYSGARGHVRLADVKLVAESFKNWLDAKDEGKL